VFSGLLSTGYIYKGEKGELCKLRGGGITCRGELRTHYLGEQHVRRIGEALLDKPGTRHQAPGDRGKNVRQLREQVMREVRNGARHAGSVKGKRELASDSC